MNIVMINKKGSNADLNIVFLKAQILEVNWIG